MVRHLMMLPLPAPSGRERNHTRASAARITAYGSIPIARHTSTNSATSRRCPPRLTCDTKVSRWPSAAASAMNQSMHRSAEPRIGQRIDHDRERVEVRLRQSVHRRNDPRAGNAASRRRLTSEREEPVGRRIENLCDAHQGRQIGFATTAHVIAVAALAQPGTTRDLCIREAELLGALFEIRGEWLHRERFVPDIPHGSMYVLA